MILFIYYHTTRKLWYPLVGLLSLLSTMRGGVKIWLSLGTLLRTVGAEPKNNFVLLKGNWVLYSICMQPQASPIISVQVCNTVTTFTTNASKDLLC